MQPCPERKKKITSSNLFSAGEVKLSIHSRSSRSSHITNHVRWRLQAVHSAIWNPEPDSKSTLLLNPIQRTEFYCLYLLMTMMNHQTERLTDNLFFFFLPCPSDLLQPSLVCAGGRTDRMGGGPYILHLPHHTQTHALGGCVARPRGEDISAKRGKSFANEKTHPFSAAAAAETNFRFHAPGGCKLHTLPHTLGLIGSVGSSSSRSFWCGTRGE